MDLQSCISIFVAYPAIPSSNYSPALTWQPHPSFYDRFVEIQSNHGRKKLHRMNEGSNFLGSYFSDRYHVRALIQFERHSQAQHLKRWFFLKNTLIHSHINSTSVLRLLKRNQSSVSSTGINQPLPTSVHIVPQIRCKFRSQF